jgi:hypothetical protein
MTNTEIPISALLEVLRGVEGKTVGWKKGQLGGKDALAAGYRFRALLESVLKDKEAPYHLPALKTPQLLALECLSLVRKTKPDASHLPAYRFLLRYLLLLESKESESELQIFSDKAFSGILSGLAYLVKVLPDE